MKKIVFALFFFAFVTAFSLLVFGAEPQDSYISADYSYVGSNVSIDIVCFTGQKSSGTEFILGYDIYTFSYKSIQGATAEKIEEGIKLTFPRDYCKNICTVVFDVSAEAYCGLYEFILSSVSSESYSMVVSNRVAVGYVGIIGEKIYNDTDLDGKITTTDARYVLQTAVGKRELSGAARENILCDGEKPVTDIARDILIASLSDKGDVVSVDMCVLPVKTEYGINEKFIPDGGKIFAKYASGVIELIDLSDTEVSGFSSDTGGQKTVTVSYREKETFFYTVVEDVCFSDSADTYADGRNFNYLCGVDMYGRTFEPVSGFDDGKDVGIFYFLAVGPHIPSAQNQIYDITELIAEGREEDVLYSAYGFGMTFFWGKPVFGYYRSGETWVVNRHIEMLSSAGVDYMLFDVSNAETYQDSYFTVLKALRKYKDAGWDVPQIGFYTHFHSSSTMDTLYETLYSNSLYTAKYGDLYYAPDGKPFIVGDYPSDEVAANMDVRPSYWPQQGEWGLLDEYGYQGFPWIEWVFEPYMHADKTICVSVAQHRNGGFSFAPVTPYTVPPRTGNNWGRGMDAEGNRNEDTYGLGQNFQRQWDIALDKGAENVFVTGWNEWTVSKLNSVEAGNVMYFCDQYNAEFSRDIEPVTGGFEDSFYLQLISNIRRYKGLNKEMSKPCETTIDVSSASDISQWDIVNNYYRNIQFFTYSRYSTPVLGGIPDEDRQLYRIKEPVNNITGVKVTNDENNIYFLITTSEPAVGNNSSEMISPDRWMNLFLSVGALKSQGWNGYKYVINRSADVLFSGMNGTGSINLLNSDGTAGAEVGRAEISMYENYIQIAVPLKDIGATGEETGFYFKIADNIVEYTDICNYYVSGKSFPMGRLSYYYYFN